MVGYTEIFVSFAKYQHPKGESLYLVNTMSDSSSKSVIILLSISMSIIENKENIFDKFNTHAFFL